MTSRKPKPLPRSVPGTSRSGAAFKESMKSDTIVKGPVERLLLANAVADESRRTDVIHPSELCKPEWCSRRAYYRITGVKESNPEKISAQSESLFSEGHFIHEKWQGWLWDLGLLEGEFFCRSCEAMFEGKAPSMCDECLSPRWALKYNEVPIVNEELLISGRADGKVEEYMLEVKSIGPGTLRMERPELFKRYQDKEITLEEMWKEIKRPLVVHIKQAMFYAWVAGLERILFIYEWKPYQAVKEFTLTLNEEYIADMIEAAEATAWAVRTKHLPRRPAGVTEDPKHLFCKSCTYKDHCWSTNANDTPTPVRVIRRRRSG